MTNPEMPDESRNIIIFTGSAHIENYVDFLNMYQYTDPRINLVKSFYNENPAKKGCVKIYDEPKIITHKRPRKK
jgi:hypothetical protein